MRNVYKILLFLNLVIIFIGTLIGIMLGLVISNMVADFVNQNYAVNLLITFNYLEIFLILSAIVVTSVFATFPVLNRLRNISPKELLSHGEKSEGARTIKSVLFDIFIGVLPITFLAMYFLQSILYGGLSIVAIILVYGGLMIFYFYFVDFVYKNRNIFNFPLKMITTQKKFDGFFGLITFASLFVALTAIYNLSIVRTSIDEYLKKDLSQTLPSTYVLDVQGSQEKVLKDNFPEITLFPNVRARIIKIDDLEVQKAIEEGRSGVDRELGREFNLTYRDYLLSSEKVVEIESGKTFESIKPGEVSVEREFAKRAGIKMGSQVVFLIQGIQLSAKVTSIREVDTRSGFPFFYFILADAELQDFPKTFFGYVNLDSDNQSELKNFLAKEFPNVSVIDTGNIAKIAENLINALLLIILIITMPPLLLSAMLIVTILASVAKERKRDGARLMALGKTHSFIRLYYILESISTTVLASAFAYIFALLVSNFVIIEFLEIESLVFFDIVSFLIFIFILFGIMLVSIFLWNAGRKSLREYLNYEENN
jgi:putative ABC transport system permease protein